MFSTKQKKSLLVCVCVCVCYVVSFFVALGVDFYHAQLERSSQSTWEKKKKEGKNLTLTT